MIPSKPTWKKKKIGALGLQLSSEFEDDSHQAPILNENKWRLQASNLKMIPSKPPEEEKLMPEAATFQDDSIQAR